MFRPALAVAVFVPLAFAQKTPAFQWIKEVDSSGQDSFAGLGVDAQGNAYIAGSTYSASFPVKNAAQAQIASSGLYLINGPGSAYAALGLSSAFFVAIDPQNPNTLYAISSGGLAKSVNGGNTFTALSLPSSLIETLAINPSNDQILYAGSFDQGLLKSTDGGATWATSNGALQALQPGEFEFDYVWIDPNNPNVMFANAIGNFIRSADGGATWQILLTDADISRVSFDTAVPGLVYAVTNQGMASVSTNDGLTFNSLTIPAEVGVILPDPNHSGRLLASTPGGILQSTDGGNTWSSGVTFTFEDNDLIFVADWANGFLYTGNQYVVRITTDLQTVTPVGPPALGFIGAIAAANGHAYVAVQGTRDVYVTKLDPSGNIVYSTYFGGSNDDVATAMTVDQSGNVYVTGSTNSLDFPVTRGAYAATGGTFLFKLNPDGTAGYSTYFAPGGNTPAAIAVDASGSAYLAGTSFGSLPTSPGAYQTTCSACGATSNGFFAVFTYSGFASKFSPTGATLLYSTYVGGVVELMGNIITTIAVGSDGTAYLGGLKGIFHLNAAGSALLGSTSPSGFTPESMAVAADGSLYVAGLANTFPTTAGAFETTVATPPSLPGQSGNLPLTVIARWDSQLANVLDATYFGAGKSNNSIVLDSTGNVYIGGGTSPEGLPTRTPIQLGFAPQTGFVSELSGDLSTLLFSGYFGDTQDFTLQGLAVSANGSVMLGGVTGNNSNTVPFDIWVNSLMLAPPPVLRVDAVVNAASLLDGAISAGETVVVNGAGFGTNAQLSIGGVAVQPISMTATTITATVPQGVPAGAAEVEVTSGGASSNQVLVAVAATSPGIFSQNGSGFGQGYILNKDGTLNTPSNPANPGDPIAIFATGVGPVSIDQGYAVSQYPVNVYVDGLFCDGIEAFIVPVPGLPGNVYEIQVYVPNPATLVSANSNLQGFTFPALVGVTMVINGVSSQNGIAFSISP
jgi:uncharacterized protein (TIGR03437 family)